MKSYWKSIWTRPRETIREVVAENPNQSIWILATISGLSSLFNFLGEAVVIIGLIPLVISLLLTPLIGMFLFSVWSGLMLLTGRLLKGQGSFHTIRAAQGWASVPLLVNIGLSIVWSLIFLMMLRGSFYFSPWVGEVFHYIKLVFAIWGLVLYVKALSEVQKFSVLKAIGNLLLSILLFCIAYGVLVFLLKLIAR